MAKVKEEHFGIARKIVSNMTSESWETIPHATMTYDADVTTFIMKCQLY
jgi:pyruvate/2-oxoglutarate dehydrogenase complex dihydrolipoamide acyltransferase (E2) component